MKSSLFLLSTILALFSTNPGFAAGPTNMMSFRPGLEAAASHPEDAVIGDELRSEGTNDLLPPIDGREDPAASPPYDFPRLSLATFWAQDWLNKPEGIEFLYQFQEIYGTSMAEDVLMIKRMARNQHQGRWAGSAVWLQSGCLATTDEWHSEPPEWAFGFARNNLTSAINMAVYMNGQLGVDWFLRDINGQKMQIWSSAHNALNLTPDCPVGAWDGVITYQGRQYSLGDTRGLTVVEWLKGPLAQTVIRNSLFSRAFDGIQSEDYPSLWMYYFNGQVPDPKRDGIGYPSPQEFEAYCRDVWRSWFLDFLKPLQDTFIIRLNGHNTRWYFDQVENPWPEIQQAANGCKLEGFYGWGGWPTTNRPMWSRVYQVIEQLYRPLLPTSDERRLDERQGWDVTTIQLNARYGWPLDRVDRYKRAGLANTLMGDGLFDGTAYEEDSYYLGYLRSGQTQYAPRDIREMRVRLGRALGPSKAYGLDRAHLVEYRQFYDAATKRTYTVVCNNWGWPIAGIPAEDGVWFLGVWPNGRFVKLNDVATPSYTEQIPEDSKPAAVVAGAGQGPLTLRAMPSITGTWSTLGFSAPVPSALDVCVFGISGRVVRTLALASGQQSVVWDGCDGEGHRVAPGMYFARAGHGPDRQTARVLIVR